MNFLWLLRFFVISQRSTCRSTFQRDFFFLNAVFVLNLQNMNLAWNLYLYEFLMPITLTFFSRFQRTVALRIIFVTDFFWGSKLIINYSVVWLLSWFKNPGMKPVVLCVQEVCPGSRYICIRNWGLHHLLTITKL